MNSLSFRECLLPTPGFIHYRCPKLAICPLSQPRKHPDYLSQAFGGHQQIPSWGCIISYSQPSPVLKLSAFLMFLCSFSPFPFSGFLPLTLLQNHSCLGMAPSRLSFFALSQFSLAGPPINDIGACLCSLVLKRIS